MANIKVRLDQALCNQEWQCLFPKAGVRHLVASSSDHVSILSNMHLEQGVLLKPFWFEAMWTKDPTSLKVVEQGWLLRVGR